MVYLKEIKSVLITDDVDERCVEILKQNGLNVTKNIKLSKEQLLEEVKKFDCLVVRSATKVTKEVLESGSQNLKLVGRAGTGVDNIDVNVATDYGILVMNTPGSNTISAAELTCAMLMALARHLPQAVHSMKDGKWERSKFVGTELFGKTLAIVGLGRVGKEVATRMRAFGMRCIGYDPIVTKEQAAQADIEFMPLEQLWPLADYITIHVPLLPETTNLVNYEVMSQQCKKDFKLVNVARGGIVDEEALLKALNEGYCGGAGLDVYAEEPTNNWELVKHPKVVCTPHLGASSKEAQNRVALDLANQLVKYVKDKVVEGAVNGVNL